MRTLLVSLSLLVATTVWAEPQTLIITGGVLQERQDVAFGSEVFGANFILDGFSGQNGAARPIDLVDSHPLVGQLVDQSGGLFLDVLAASVNGTPHGGLSGIFQGTVQVTAVPAPLLQVSQGEAFVTSPFTLSGMLGPYRLEGSGVMTTEFFPCASDFLCTWTMSRLMFSDGTLSESLLVHAPEPTTWALLVTGLIGLTIKRRVHGC